MLPSWLKKDKDMVKYSGDGKFLFYIPEDYFVGKNTAKAMVYGEYINLLGIIDYQLVDKNGKGGPMKLFKFPTIFVTKPGKIRKVKGLKLSKNSDEQDYRVLEYYDGDIIVLSTKVPQDLITNVEAFYNLFTYGKLPGTIPYDQLYTYIVDNLSLNGGSYNMTMQMFGVVISEMCRDPKDLSKPFRLSKSNDMTDYKLINIRDIPKYVSSYSAITSENWDNAVANAIVNNSEHDIPMEKILMDA